MSTWQPIESAPTDGQPVIVWLTGNRDDAFNNRAAVVRFDRITSNIGRGIFWSMPAFGGLRASHWQPAPGAP